MTNNRTIIETIVVMPSMLSNMFMEFINPITQNTVNPKFKASFVKILILVSVKYKIKPHTSWAINFNRGLVL